MRYTIFLGEFKPPLVCVSSYCQKSHIFCYVTLCNLLHPSFPVFQSLLLLLFLDSQRLGVWLRTINAPRKKRKNLYWLMTNDTCFRIDQDSEIWIYHISIWINLDINYSNSLPWKVPQFSGILPLTVPARWCWLSRHHSCWKITVVPTYPPVN